MRVSGIFHSIQGEGFLAGVPSVFVRLAGCPLRCVWCDTKYAWDVRSGREMTVEGVVERVGRFECGHVVVTGGEPMVNPALAGLLRRLAMGVRHITVETAGIAFIPELPCELMSISPKLGNSAPRDPRSAARHERLRLNRPAIAGLIGRYDYQLKFVVDSPDDILQVREVLEGIDGVDLRKVMLMPRAATRLEYLEKAPLVAEMCRQTGFAFSPRLQVVLWDNARGR
jgi:7-carboxy-7-deazaguanine synthase